MALHKMVCTLPIKAYKCDQGNKVLVAGGAISVLNHVTADVSLHIRSSVLRFNEAEHEGGMHALVRASC